MPQRLLIWNAKSLLPAGVLIRKRALTVNMSILPKSARLRFRFIRGKIFPREPSTPFVNKPD